MVALLLVSSCTQQSEGDTRVYVTKSGSKYHTGECEHLGKSKVPIKLSDAIVEGYMPCQKCRARQINLQRIHH